MLSEGGLSLAGSVGRLGWKGGGRQKPGEKKFTDVPGQTWLLSAMFHKGLHLSWQQCPREKAGRIESYPQEVSYHRPGEMVPKDVSTTGGLAFTETKQFANSEKLSPWRSS